MKHILALAAIAAFTILGLTVAVSSLRAQTTGNVAVPTDQRTVLSATTANGVTTTLYVGRVQTDPAKDGTATLTVFPAKVLTDSAGNVLSDGLDTTRSFTVPLTAAQYAGIASIITQAFNTQTSTTVSGTTSSTTTTSTTSL